MSWVRWGPGRQPYVFQHYLGFMECCGCTLSGPLTFMGQSALLKRRSHMLLHLRAHRDNGDKVPEYAFKSGRRDLEKYGDVVTADPANIMGGYCTMTQWPILFRLRGVWDPATKRRLTGLCSMCAGRGVVHRARMSTRGGYFYHLCTCSPDRARAGKRVSARMGGVHIACPQHPLLLPPDLTMDEWLERNRG